MRNEYDDQGRLTKNTDADGKVITYTHDIAGKIEIITDRLGNSTRHRYDDRGNILETTDAEGGITTYAYDTRNNKTFEQLPGITTGTKYIYNDDNQVTEITDPVGNKTTFAYNAYGQVTSTTDARGNTTPADPNDGVTKNVYDGLTGTLTNTTDPRGFVTNYTYDANGNLASEKATLTSGQVVQTSYTHDPRGKLTRLVEPQGGKTVDYSYDNNGNKTLETTTRTTPAGVEQLVTTYQYDAEDRLVKTIYPDGSATGTIYNEIGKPAVTVDQLGNQTSFVYDVRGNLITTTFPDGTTEQLSYDAENRRRTSTDRVGRVTEYIYGRIGRLVRTTYPGGDATETSYDPAGRVTAGTDARGNTTTYGYDNAGRRTSVKNALNQISGHAYDANGNQIAFTDARGNTTRYEYNQLNRRARTIFPAASADLNGDGQITGGEATVVTETRTEYDELGRRTAEIDQNGNTTRFGYDAVGRLTTVTDALSQVTMYGYDELGNQASQTDALGHVTRYEYDKLGRRTKRTLPLAMSETAAYDAGGNQSSKTDFNGFTTMFVYDEMNRLRQKTPDARRGEPPITFSYTPAGRRSQMTDASGITTYAYDLRDRLLGKATPQGILSYTYDGSGNVQSIKSSNANGANVTYQWDALNRLASVNDTHVGPTTYAYDAVGNLGRFATSNGVTHTYAYNALNRLTNLTVASVAAGGPIASYAYTLAPAAQRTSVTELSGRTASYQVDLFKRLKQETIGSDPGGKNGTISYTYDAVGNRLTRSSSVQSITPQSFTYDANDRLTTDGYDKNGNTTAGKVSLDANGAPAPERLVNDSYDFEDQLTSRTSAVGAVIVVYDGDGNKVRETAGGQTTSYLVDDRNPTGYAQVLEELLNQVLREFTRTGSG